MTLGKNSLSALEKAKSTYEAIVPQGVRKAVETTTKAAVIAGAMSLATPENAEAFVKKKAELPLDHGVKKSALVLEKTIGGTDIYRTRAVKVTKKGIGPWAFSLHSFKSVVGAENADHWRLLHDAETGEQLRHAKDLKYGHSYYLKVYLPAEKKTTEIAAEKLETQAEKKIKTWQKKESKKPQPNSEKIAAKSASAAKASQTLTRINLAEIKENYATKAELEKNNLAEVISLIEARKIFKTTAGAYPAKYGFKTESEYGKLVRFPDGKLVIDPTKDFTSKANYLAASSVSEAKNLSKKIGSLGKSAKTKLLTALRKKSEIIEDRKKSAREIHAKSTVLVTRDYAKKGVMQFCKDKFGTTDWEGRLYDTTRKKTISHEGDLQSGNRVTYLSRELLHSAKKAKSNVVNLEEHRAEKEKKTDLSARAAKEAGIRFILSASEREWNLSKENIRKVLIDATPFIQKFIPGEQIGVTDIIRKSYKGKHYYGRAMDIRTQNFGGKMAKSKKERLLMLAYFETLQKNLGKKNFQVLNEDLTIGGKKTRHWTGNHLDIRVGWDDEAFVKAYPKALAKTQAEMRSHPQFAALYEKNNPAPVQIAKAANEEHPDLKKINQAEKTKPEAQKISAVKKSEKAVEEKIKVAKTQIQPKTPAIAEKKIIEPKTQEEKTIQTAAQTHEQNLEKFEITKTSIKNLIDMVFKKLDHANDSAKIQQENEKRLKSAILRRVANDEFIISDEVSGNLINAIDETYSSLRREKRGEVLKVAKAS